MRMAVGKLLRVGATLGLLAVGGFLAFGLWRYYTEAPWTRDGRVRAEVVSVAPEISGRVAEVRISDNQFVHKGDVLYTIDRQDFELNLALAEAAAEQRSNDLSDKSSDNERREKLSNIAISDAEREHFRAAAAIARAAQAEAARQVDKARLDLERAEVRAPVSGYVTNLRLRAGDYANKGVANIALIDSDSFWIVGYFEETKMAAIHIGDRAEAALMGYGSPVIGHVETIARGISDQNGAADGKGLADVNPVFSWVRLAQRIPVRIHIDQVPQGVDLAAGMTCTINVSGAEAENSGWNGLIRRLKPWS
jgi:multidrug resistance efflux pump